jgi:pilus assembly protein Flp/PilA
MSIDWRLILAERRFLRDVSGVTSIEYALIAGIVAVALISGASLIGGGLSNLFTNLHNHVAVAAA